jgi:hypothetical protein
VSNHAAGKRQGPLVSSPVVPDVSKAVDLLHQAFAAANGSGSAANHVPDSTCDQIVSLLQLPDRSSNASASTRWDAVGSNLGPHRSSRLETINEISKPSHLDDQVGSSTLQVVKEKVPFYFRCKTKGHQLSECIIELFCEVCDVKTHLTSKCPVVRTCNTFAVPSGYAVDGLGFYYIPQPTPVKSKQGSYVGTVTVVEGSMTEEQITSELRRLVATEWDWSVKGFGNNVFSTGFPSMSELQRMIEWGTIHTKFGAKMQVKEEGSGEEIKYVMPKVWVQFTGLPKELREYPVIWVVGSMLGISKEVDMVFTRKFDRARLQVAVLDPNLIPQYVDVVIGDYIYELKFKVELAIDGDQPLPMDMDDSGANDDDEFQDQNKEGSLGEKGSRGSVLLDQSNGSTGAVDMASSAQQNNKVGTKSGRDGGPVATHCLA